MRKHCPISQGLCNAEDCTFWEQPLGNIGICLVKLFLMAGINISSILTNLNERPIEVGSILDRLRKELKLG